VIRQRDYVFYAEAEDEFGEWWPVTRVTVECRQCGRDIDAPESRDLADIVAEVEAHQRLMHDGRTDKQVRADMAVEELAVMRDEDAIDRLELLVEFLAHALVGVTDDRQAHRIDQIIRHLQSAAARIDERRAAP
jgi:hypothetical protein